MSCCHQEEKQGGLQEAEVGFGIIDAECKGELIHPVVDSSWLVAGNVRGVLCLQPYRPLPSSCFR